MNISKSTPPLGFGSHWLVRTGLTDQGDIVTFYSYKGGTGRSMALVNCGGLIAQRLPTDAKPVLLIDFDLEAPGLHRYLTPFLPPSEISIPRLGLLELFEGLGMEIDQTLSNSTELASSEMRRLDDETTAGIISNFDLAPFAVATNVPGMHAIMAGRFDESYAQRLSSFNWEGLFAKAPALFRCLAERLAREYSFTFVDSRTGLSDTSGICTMLLPNVLVVVFTPNNQSLTGIEHLVRKAVEYRSSASDSRELRVYPLPSRVDNQVEHFRHVWRMGDSQHPLFGAVKGYQPLFQEVLDFTSKMAGTEAPTDLTEYFDVVQVPHSADYSYGERLCFESSTPGDSLSVRGSYEQFLPWLVTGAQPWERPAELLLNQQASRWLHDLGVDVIPESDDGWHAWFNRLSGALSNSEHPVLLQQTSLSSDLRFDTNLVQALAYAYEGNFGSSKEWLKKAMTSYREDVSSTIPNSAPMQLLKLWCEILAPAELRTSERKAWIKEFEQLVSRWQALRNQRRIWVLTVIQLTDKAGWHDMKQLALQQLVGLNRETFGNEHPDTLASMNDLALTLSEQGDYVGASALQRQVLELRQRHFRAEHPDTLSSMNNLAQTLQAQGDVAGARDLQERALALHKRILGEEHPATLTSMNNLAQIQKDQGDLVGARDLQERVLALHKRILGEEHPTTVTFMNNLAQIQKAQGDLAGARALEEQTLTLAKNIYGEEHSLTLTAMNCLADILNAQGDLSGARTLHEQTLALRKRLLGEEHPGTLRSMNNLANTLLALGDIEGARTLQEQVLALRKRLLGEEHPAILTSMNNLALTLQAQGDLVGARALFEQTLALRKRVLGEEHPATLTSMNNLAQIQKAQGDVAGARALEEQTLALHKHILGEEHPATLTSMNNLAQTLQAQGDVAGARDLQERALALHKRILGEEHPATLTSMNNLAQTLQAQGDVAGARDLQERALALHKRILGEEHPTTIAFMNNLAQIQKDQGDVAGARKLTEQALTLAKRILGEKHPTTIRIINNMNKILKALVDKEAL